jgi:hypothetical protein
MFTYCSGALFVFLKTMIAALLDSAPNSSPISTIRSSTRPGSNHNPLVNMMFVNGIYVRSCCVTPHSYFISLIPWAIKTLATMYRGLRLSILQPNSHIDTLKKAWRPCRRRKRIGIPREYDLARNCACVIKTGGRVLNSTLPYETVGAVTHDIHRYTWDIQSVHDPIPLLYWKVF